MATRLSIEPNQFVAVRRDFIFTRDGDRPIPRCRTCRLTRRVIRTAPIVAYMLGRDRQRVLSYAERDRWRTTWID